MIPTISKIPETISGTTISAIGELGFVKD